MIVLSNQPIPKQEGGIAMATILLTGATGTVGSCLAPLLVREGHQVICVVRPKDGKSPKSRIKEILGRENNGISVVKGDVTLPHAGISYSERQRLRGRIDEVVHCAASIKFDDVLVEEITRVNVGGTTVVLELARELRISEFHHISTAYIAGDADYFGESDFDLGQTCRNVYERTKREAEGLVRGWQHGKYSIYRLGIVVGESKTGYTSSFTGYYRPFASFWFLRQGLNRRVGAEPERYKAEGIAFDAGGILTLPLCLNCSPVSTLNLVPRDWAARILADLIAIPVTGQTFHVVHPNPPQVRRVTDVSLSCLGITEYHYGTRANHEPDSLLEKLQKRFEYGVRQYSPYIIHEPKFEALNMVRMLGLKYSPPPDVDKVFLTRLLNYAKSVNFGRAKTKERRTRRRPKAVEV